jgi:ATP-dependent DNA ligase
MVLDGVDVTREPLDARRQLLEARLRTAVGILRAEGVPEPVRQQSREVIERRSRT